MTSNVSNKSNPRSELETALVDDANNNFTQRYTTVRQYQDSLAKPVGSLGSIEDYGARIAALQRSARPVINKPICLIFAADHGVAKDKSDGGMNCSSYPQAVSRKVCEGLDHGIAGASALARCNNVSLQVIDVGLSDGSTQYEWSNKVVHSSDSKLDGGTKNFCRGSAMSKEEVERLILVGRKETTKVIDEHKVDMMLFGEVGIGNTTTSSALIAALTGVEVQLLCGTGASTTRDGIDDDVIAKKISIIKEAMNYHKASSLLGKPLKALEAVGGAEICAMVGGMLESSECNVPILVDGFITTTAAMIASMIDSSVTRTLLFATQSTEKGQAIALDVIKDIALSNNYPAPTQPALNMSLRMGEATGALLALPLCRSACAIVSELASLTEVLEIEM